MARGSIPDHDRPSAREPPLESEALGHLRRPGGAALPEPGARGPHGVRPGAAPRVAAEPLREPWDPVGQRAVLRAFRPRVGAFIAASPALHGVLRWGGIAYLVWMALGWIARKPEEGAQVRAADGTPRALYVQALATQLANPKAIIFFVSFLAPFLDTKAAWRWRRRSRSTRSRA